MIEKWKLEDDVNDYVKNKFSEIGLKKLKDYNVESSMSDYMKDALKGSAKTKTKTNFGKPDFHVEKYNIPVIFEDKLGIKKLIAKNKDGIKDDEKSIQNFATNGAIHYATQIIASGKYKEAVAIGVAGDHKENVVFDIYYIFGSSFKSIKRIENYTSIDFLENEKTFSNFYHDCVLTEEEKHEILITSRTLLQKYAGELNKLMHNHNITAPQRVLYVSGMLLSMQDIVDEDRKLVQRGLIPEDLLGAKTDTKRDGILITNQIKEYLKQKQIRQEKVDLMLSSFSEISKDNQRDELTDLDKLVGKLLEKEASTNKQIFTYIFNNIYMSIDAMAGHLDIMGEMYSEFLKYALGDGKEIGIVLTPPYVTKMMAEILNVNKDSRTMDLATGSAGFLISSMEIMIDDANKTFGKDTSKANKKIEEIKKEQLLGVELNAEMFTLAATNMILRGDGSSNIRKGNTFRTPEELYTNFKANRLLLNPPFSFEENGMPFIRFGLSKMEKGGLAAIIIQDSAGSGRAVSSNQEILKNNTLLASIKMPVDLFIPMAGVQTSIYVFEAGTPHDYEKTVKFIDFRNDGYKRTKRGLNEVDSPTERYQDIIKLYKAGKSAKVTKNLWDIDEIYIEDFITDGGNDWNFEQHKKVDTKPKLEDFKKTVADYLAWEVANILKSEDKISKKSLSPRLEKLKKEFLENGGEWETRGLSEFFEIQNTLSFNKDRLVPGNEYDYVTRTSNNQGILESTGFINDENLNSSNTWSLGLLQMDFFYRRKPWYAGQFVKKIIPKIKMTPKVTMYFTVVLNKQKEKLLSVLVRDVDEVFNSACVDLPFLNGKINFSYMEKFIEELEAERIEELEAERIEELEAYLMATGIKDYKLTKEDQKILDDFEIMSDNSLDRQTDRQTDRQD